MKGICCIIVEVDKVDTSNQTCYPSASSNASSVTHPSDRTTALAEQYQEALVVFVNGEPSDVSALNLRQASAALLSTTSPVHLRRRNRVCRWGKTSLRIQLRYDTQTYLLNYEHTPQDAGKSQPGDNTYIPKTCITRPERHVASFCSYKDVCRVFSALIRYHRHPNSTCTYLGSTAPETY